MIENIAFILASLNGILWVVSSILALRAADIKNFIFGIILAIVWFFLAKIEWKEKKGE